MWSAGDNVEDKARDPRNRRVGGGRLGEEVKSNSGGGFETVGSVSGASENLRDGGVVGGSVESSSADYRVGGPGK